MSNELCDFRTVICELFSMKDGILLVGYGTRKGNLEKIMEAQAARLRASTDYEIGVGYFRISSPAIPDALEQLVRKGVDRVVVVPYYVAEGTLTLDLIPQKLGLKARMSNGVVEVAGRSVQIHISAAFNFSTLVTDVLCERIMECGGSRDSGILLLGHGTRDPSMMNRSVVERNAQRLRARGYRHVEFAFNEFCEPSIKDSLARLASAGVEHIACVPLFIAMGLHLGEEIPEQIDIPAYSDGGSVVLNGRRIGVSYTRPLEDDPRLTSLVLSRVAEYLSD